MRIAQAVSRITTPILMGVLFFAVLTPIGFLRRLIGNNPLVHEPEEGSYWKSRPEGEHGSDLERQF